MSEGDIEGDENGSSCTLKQFKLMPRLPAGNMGIKLLLEPP